MDIEGFVAAHRPQWDRLAHLAGRTRLTGAEADELVELYQRTATHLAVVRGSAYDPELEATLSTLVTNGRAAITGTGGSVLTGLAVFFGATLPAAFYRLRWWALAVTLACLGLATVVCLRALGDPALLHLYFSDEQIDYYVNVAFAGYYSANPSAHFAMAVWLHNALLAASAILLGITVVPTVIMLYYNSEWLGYVAALMINRERADVFFGMLLPHGMLELTCIFFAGAAGLRMAWAWIAPGPVSRARRLAAEGRTLGAVVIGLAVALGISGVLEAYVTPAGLVPSARLGIGFAVWLAFLCYVLVLGRRAVRAGHTGDVTGAQTTALDPVEAAV